MKQIFHTIKKSTHNNNLFMLTSALRQIVYFQVKQPLIITLSAIALTSCGGGPAENNTSTQGVSPPLIEPPGNTFRETRIVGGNEISHYDFHSLFPFLTQLSPETGTYTVTNNAGTGFYAHAIARVPDGVIEGPLTSCSEWQTGFCPQVQGAICAIDVFPSFNFSRSDVLRAVDSCTAGGGIAVAFIGNNQDETSVSFSLRTDAAAIPAVYISSNPNDDTEEFRTLINNLLNQPVTISRVEVLVNANCAASYLGDNWILTAAHCTRSGLFSSAAIGVYSRSEALVNKLFIPSAPNGHIYRDLPAFESSQAGHGPNEAYDYALVQLQSPPLGGTPVKIASPDTLQQLLESRARVQVMGWGTNKYGEDNSQDKPRIATQHLVPSAECNDKWLGGIDPYLHVCAIADPVTQDACQGDSGGPLVAEVGGEIQLVGITSFGIGCAVADAPPAVYANATSLIHWINQVTGLDVGATQSPKPEPVTPADIPRAAECIDSDGDGWGWDGQQSCRPVQQSQSQLNVEICIDTDGDGWGWTGTRSCLITE